MVDRYLSQVGRMGVVAALFLPLAVNAATVGTVGSVFQGQDELGTAVGVYGAVDVGNHEESGDTLQAIGSTSGNAITIFMSDELASLAAQFSITFNGCSGAGTFVVNLSAPDFAGVCGQIDGHASLACSERFGDDAVDIIGPFLCTVGPWSFTTGTVPARKTTVDITGITNGEAAAVDFFAMSHGATLIQSTPTTFTGVTTVAQLATALDGLSGLIDASSAGGTTLTIDAASTGPTSFTGLRLEVTTPATTTSVPITGLDDATAGAVDLFTLSLGGVPVDQSTVDLSTVANLAQLIAELDGIPGIGVTANGPTGLTITASTPGFVTFSNLALRVEPQVGVTDGAVVYTENDSPLVIDAGLTVSHDVAVDLTGATATLTAFHPAEDVLSFTPTAGIVGEWSGGTLTLSNEASVSDYQAALRSVTYHNTSDDPTAGSTTVSFVVDDGLDASDPVARDLQVAALNDPPTVTVTPLPLDFSEGETRTLDSGLLLADLDDIDLQSASVSISGGFAPAEDVLAFVDTGSISGSFVVGTLTLTGPATVASFQAALRSVTYTNLDDDPDTTPRTVSFTADDGTGEGVAATRELTVTPVNDPPQVALFTESVAPPVGLALPLDDDLAITDPDDSMLDSATVAFSDGFVEGEDWLTFVDQGGITGLYDDVAGVLTLDGEASIAAWEAALRTVAYENLEPSPTESVRTVSLRVADASEESDTVDKLLFVGALFVDGFESGDTTTWSTTSP